MIRAFGYCTDTFDTGAPGRLCRGRERWIEGLPDDVPAGIFRTVVSGAMFSDDSARDAKRGFKFSGVSAGTLFAALFPKAKVYAFAHAGDPLALPKEMALEEDWRELVHGGVTERPAVRWISPVAGPLVDLMMEGEVEGLAVARAEGFVVVKGRGLPEGLADSLYHLSGFATPHVHPAELYAATAIPGVLNHALAVVLLHMDKHGPALSFYTREALDASDVLFDVAVAAGSFAVPFAIPPMLARWDRALYEMRLDWDSETDGEFPVPPANDAGGRWSSRGRRNSHHEQNEAPEAGAAVEE